MTLSSLSRSRRATQPIRSRSAARMEMLEDRTLPPFRTPIEYPTAAPSQPGPYAVAVADFNADGAPDLAVANYQSSSSVAIVLNNGDGTFRKPQIYALKYTATAIGVGDFN